MVRLQINESVGNSVCNRTLPTAPLMSPCFITLPWLGLSTLHPCPVIICRCYLLSICCKDSENRSHSGSLTLPQTPLHRALKSFQREHWEQEDELKCRREGKSRTFMSTWGIQCNLMQPLFDDSCFNSLKSKYLSMVLMNICNDLQDKFSFLL